jgi:hypothetical protein
MKTAITALVALIAAAPAVLAENVLSKTPHQPHHASRTHPHTVSAGYATRHAMHAKGNPGAFGYAPEPKDYFYENSKNAGGGGSGM